MQLVKIDKALLVGQTSSSHSSYLAAASLETAIIAELFNGRGSEPGTGMRPVCLFTKTLQIHVGKVRFSVQRSVKYKQCVHCVYFV